MAQTIFDKLRAFETQGEPLHALIEEACNRGNALVATLETIAAADDLQPGHIAYLSKGAMARLAEVAAARAYADNGHTPDNGKAVA